MDEAINELRYAIHLALSLDRDDEGLQNEARAEFSEGTYVSSLSGSLPSDKSAAAAAAVAAVSTRRRLCDGLSLARNDPSDEGGGCGWHHSVANRVKAAVENYEVVAFDFYNETVPSWIDVPTDKDMDAMMMAETDANQADIVDLLVAVMTAVPRHLYREPLAMRRGDDARDAAVYDAHLGMMEQICFDATSVASDVLIKYFCHDGIQNRVFVGARHAFDLIDEVVSICEGIRSQRGWSLLGPLVKVLNSYADGSLKFQKQPISRLEYGEVGNHQPRLLSDLCAKETLRLTQILVDHFIWEYDNESRSQLIMSRGGNALGYEASSHVGIFIGHLLEHFVHMASLDAGCRDGTDDEQFALFEAWADGTDEHHVQRLNDDDAQMVPTLITQYHVVTIESASELVENTRTLIKSVMAENNDGELMPDECLSEITLAVQGTIRNVAMAVTVTEVMEKLGLPCAQDINVIFHPLVVSYARFVATYLHDALLLLRRQCPGNEGQHISDSVDDLLLRICGTNLGIEFLRGEAENDEQDEVITIALLRAMASQGQLKASFLLNIASDRINFNIDKSAPANLETVPKRQRFNSLECGNDVRSGRHARNHRILEEQIFEEAHSKMTDILLTCLALSQQNQEDEIDEQILDQLSSIAGSMLCQLDRSDKNNAKERAIVNHLNPWHTLQVKPMKKLMNTLQLPRDGGRGAPGSLVLYSSSVPCFYDTTASKVSL